MAARFARVRKAPSRGGGLHYARCPRCDAEYGGWEGVRQSYAEAESQAREHNAENHGGDS